MCETSTTQRARRNPRTAAALISGTANEKERALGRKIEVDYNDTHPIHDAVFGDFGNDPDGFFNDTPPGAIGENVNYVGIAAAPERNQPMRNMGDSDQGDRQPMGGPRR